MISLVILILLIVLYAIYVPYIDRTSNGDIIIWYNNNGKRTYKYLWKRNM